MFFEILNSQLVQAARLISLTLDFYMLVGRLAGTRKWRSNVYWRDISVMLPNLIKARALQLPRKL